MKKWILCFIPLIAFSTESFYLEQENIDCSVGGWRPTFFPDDTNGWKCAAEFLYFQSTIDGYSYAVSFDAMGAHVFSSFLGPNDFLPNGRFYDIEYGWSPGARISLGNRFAEDNWEMTLSWTTYYNHSHGRAQIDSLATESLFALWFPTPFYDSQFNALNAKASLSLTYNVIDLEIARAAFATKRIALEPFMGLRGALIHQHFIAHYSDGLFYHAPPSVTSVEQINHNNFGGFGIRGGLRSSWFLTKQWSFYANSSASMLYGQFALRQRSHLTSASMRDLVTAKDSFWRNVFAADIGAGLRWDWFFGCAQKHVQLSFGYELDVWFDQNQLVNNINVDNLLGVGAYADGDLGLQGINVSARFDF